MRGSGGFTLIELMVVLVLIAIITTFALPNLLGSKLITNETAAIGTMRHIVTSQVQFADKGGADVDGNGVGEYGTLGEMSGNVPVRAANGGTRILSPNLVSVGLRFVTPLGELVRHGYHFRVYLPGANGDGLPEIAGGGADANVDPSLAENIWCIYAWPQSFGVTGRRTFFANQSGNILYTEDWRYEGAGAPIQAGAALTPGGAVSSIAGVAVVNDTGRDGNVWKAVGQ